MHTYSLTDLCNSPSPALSLCANSMHSDTISGYVFVQERDSEEPHSKSSFGLECVSSKIDIERDDKRSAVAQLVNL